MQDNRPSIPASIERVLRQEAGFGCCRCGIPIIEYHHIIPFAICQVHEARDMMCLCPLHHAEADRATPQEEQRQWKAAPVNISKGYVNGNLKVNQSVIVVDAGTVQFIGTNCIVRIDRRELFKLELDDTGRVLLSVELLDKHNKPLVHIDRNEWRSGDGSLWDIRADFQKLTVNEKRGEVSLRIDTSQDHIRFTGSLWYNGTLVRITPSGIRYGKLKFDGGVFKAGEISHLGLVCMTIALNTQKHKAALVPTGPSGHGVVVSREKKEQRIQEGVAAYHHLMANPPTDSLEHLFDPDL